MTHDSQIPTVIDMHMLLHDWLMQQVRPPPKVSARQRD